MVGNAISMLTVLTPTPRMLVRWIMTNPFAWTACSETSRRLCCLVLPICPHLILDPGVGARESFFKRNFRLPPQHLSETCIIRVASSYSLRAGNMPLDDADTSDVGNQVSQ